MDKFKVGIVLINYNVFEDTIACVKSILNSSIKSLFIVIVDNNSKNKHLLNKIKSLTKNVHLIFNSNNEGFGKANNIGIDWILNNIFTNYIFLLNNDTIINKNSIHNLINVFPKEKDTVMVTPKILTYESRPRVWYAGGRFNQNKMSVDIFRIGRFDGDFESRNVDFASGCAMLFKSEFFKTNLCFDENFFMYDEDLELCIRLFKKRKKIFFINDSVIYHKCQGSQNNNNHFKLNQLHPFNPNLQFYLSLTIRNRYYIINKHYNGIEKIYKKIILSFYWFSKSIQFFIYRKFSSSFLTLKTVFMNFFNSEPVIMSDQ